MLEYNSVSELHQSTSARDHGDHRTFHVHSYTTAESIDPITNQHVRSCLRYRHIYVCLCMCWRLQHKNENKENQAIFFVTFILLPSNAPFSFAIFTVVHLLAFSLCLWTDGAPRVCAEFHKLRSGLAWLLLDRDVDRALSLTGEAHT